MSHKPLVILTGAGISQESGLATFRDHDGLWEGHAVEQVATPEAFMTDPHLVHKFYNARRSQLQSPDVKPNLAHQALAELEEQWKAPFLLVTQNIDNLHERAGSKNILHMHGELLKARNTKTEEVIEWTEDLSVEKTPDLRPHVVWFGEMPLYMPEIYKALDDCGLFISIGTSGMVYPAAQFVQQARRGGAETIEANLKETAISHDFDKHYVGPASEAVSQMLKELLG